MKLYSYFRSSAGYRTRIALNLKGITYETVSIHLQKNVQCSPDYLAVNPQARVPSLQLPSGEIITQSLAIIEYLDETVPEPPLLPRNALLRARVRALAQIIACDIHPINNLAPLRYLKDPLGHDQAAIDAWYRHWILAGFPAIEAMIEEGPYAFGDQITLADVCIVPQMANARRFKVPLDAFPKLVAVDAACAKLPAFEKALPQNQPDAE